MAGRIEITPHIRVLEAGADGWAVWDDYAEECPLYPTEVMAVAAARQIAAEYALEHDSETTDGDC